ncbi:MAG: CBS domain-containing protein [bacterium]
MKTVRDILYKKGLEIWSVAPTTPIFEALELMDKKNIGAVLVLDSGELVGVFSERDYARKVVLKGKSSKETPVGDAMTGPVTCVRPDQRIEECMALMTDKRVRHLPVIENNQLSAVISIGDVVEAIISEQEFIIDQLENYITGVR